jgi:hypothetical protein
LISLPNLITTAQWQTKRHRRRSWLFRKFILEKHYQQRRDRMLQKMKERVR